MAGRGGRGGFEPGGFDPKMIVAQIAAMQALLYLSLGAFMLLFNGLSGRPATAVGLEQVLSSRALRLSSPGGTISLMAFFFNALAGGCFLVVVVERAKKCLDFAATWHILHMCACTLYDGWPEGWEWWVANIGGATAMTLLGEYLCMRHEMREIPLRDGGFATR